MTKTFSLLGVLLLLVSLTPALADTISPSSFSTSLAVGGSTTIHKDVTITAGAPTTSLVDVFFLADTTGSMTDVIGAVQTAALSILNSTASLGDVAFGVGTYRDTGDAYVYQFNQDITSNKSLVTAGINSWSADGGGDTKEAELYALDSVANGTSWRTGSARILVWMGDSAGHDPSVGVTEAVATADLIAKGIKVEAMDTLVTDYSCTNGYGLDACGQATRITSATGGALYHGTNASSIVTAITNAITTSFATYGAVGLDLSEAGPHVTVTSTGSHTGSFDRSVDRTFGFDVTFTGASTGTDAFKIYATVDGGRVAAESDTISVGVPEPSSVVLLGFMLLGSGIVLRKRLS